MQILLEILKEILEEDLRKSALFSLISREAQETGSSIF